MKQILSQNLKLWHVAFSQFFLQDVRARDEEVVDEHAINHLMHDKGKVYPKLVGTPCIS